MSQNILVDAPELSEAEPLADNAENDYVDTVQESESEQPDETPSEDSIPEKYRGKSLEEIIEMHQNAEKKIGQQANEVGTYRELLSTLSEVKKTPAQDETDTAETSVEVTADDIYDNPTEAIQRVVEQVVNKAIKPLTESQQAASIQQEIAQLKADHPDLEQIGAEDAFQEFVAKSPYRTADAQRWVENKDISAARRLVEEYKEFKSYTSPAQEEEPKEDEGLKAAKKAATESGRSTGATGKKTLSKREIQKVFIQDRERYDSPAFQKMLWEHAKKGTLVD
jgi:hypothetical protein